jgi:hypothetical protein
MIRGKNFDQAKELKLHSFSRELFKKTFGQLDTTFTFEGVREILKKGINDLRAQLS